MKIELIDFVAIIQANITISGEVGKRNWLNAYITKSGYNAEIRDRGLLRSCFGRSENFDLDYALLNLAESVSGQTIKLKEQTYDVPNLIHTKGYRGR